MNKSGEIILIGAIIMLVITGLGVYEVYNASNSFYVGNKETKTFVNYFTCAKEAKQISPENLVTFRSKLDALEQNYTLMSGCG